ncbi:hypothetical protein HGRIS_004294 [Hohenbuehelia grisea]|uniref:Myeloid/lymphoid or mixed-lineage leukemia n=1 Tax=Hohenbuehelia grisea TaxID=104357 RepID=A0ABR3IPB8_9AGAR
MVAVGRRSKEKVTWGHQTGGVTRACTQPISSGLVSAPIPHLKTINLCHDPPPSASPRPVRSGKRRKRLVSPMQGRGRKRSHRVLGKAQEGLGKDGFDSDTLTLTVAQPVSTKHGISAVEAEHDEDECPHARGRSTARGRKPAKGGPTKKPRADEVIVAETAADNMDVDKAELTEHASESDFGGPARRTRSRSRSRVRTKPSNSLIAVAVASQKRRHAAQSSQSKPIYKASKASTIPSKPKSTTKAARSSTSGSAASSSPASTLHISRASLPDVSTTPLKRTSTHSRSRSNVAVVDIPVLKPQSRIRTREVVASSIEGET